MLLHMGQKTLAIIAIRRTRSARAENAEVEMNEAGKIVIPREFNTNVCIRTPTCQPYRRWERDIGVTIYRPIVEALEQAGDFPLSDSIITRLDDFAERAEFRINGTYTNPEAERKHYKKSLNNAIDAIKALKHDDSHTLYDICSRHSFAELALTHVLRPDDFTFEQRLNVFQAFSKKVVDKLEEDYAGKLADHYFTRWPVYLVSENCTLKEWNTKYHERVEKRISDFIKAETALRRVDQFDWSPLGFIFGSEVSTFAQLQAAALISQLKLSCDTVRTEFDNYLQTVNSAAQLGAMRSNYLEFSAMFLEKFKVWLYIRDVGTGTRIFGSISQSIKDITDVALGVGTLAALPVVLLAKGDKK